MNLRLFYPLTWLLLTYKDYCKVGAAITTVNFTGFGLLQNESLLEGDVLAECGTQWYKVCSINKKASILTEDVIRVCTDHYLYLYTHLQNNYDSIGLVTDNVSEIVNVYGQGCELKHDSCAPMFLRCPVLQPSVPTITFGELNVTHPVSTQDLKEGDTVYMTCSVYGGIPKPAFTWQTETMSNMETDRTKWYRNNAAINNTDETILFYQTIRVNLTRENNQDIYRCNVTLGGISQLTEKQLRVQFAPIISIQESHTAQESTSVTILCTIHSNPVSTTELLKPDGNGMQAFHKVQNPNEKVPHTITYTYFIGSVISSDAGIYKCWARNKIGGVDQERYNTTVLVVEFAPIIFITGTQLVTENASVTIQCTVYGCPVSDTKLLKPDGQILEHHGTPANGTDPYNITYNFNIDNVTAFDWGEYTCVARNTIAGVDQEQNKTTTLFIKFAPIISILDSQTTQESANVSIQCTVYSNPAPHTKLLKPDGQEIPVHHHVPESSELGPFNITYSFDVGVVTRSDAGKYKCWATNTIGAADHERHKTTMLVVESKTKNCTAIIRERKCTCNKRSTKIKPQQNLTTEVLMEMMEETKKQLTRDRTSLSSYTSTKVSATDNRPSSISLGFLGIVVITMAVAFIVSGDVMHCVIKFRMKFLKDNIPLMEKGQVEVSESNEDGGDTAISDEKPGTSCDHNNELKYDSMCSLNDKDSITSLSYMTSGTKEEEQAKENGTMTPTTATDIETESKLNDIEEIFVAPVDRKNRTSDAVNEPILRSDNAEKAESVTELPVGTDEDKRTELLPLAAVSSIVRDNNEGADISTKVKKVQKSSDKFSPYKRGKVNPSSLKSNSKSKVNLFHPGIKASNVTEKPPTASKDMTSNTAKGKK